MFSWSFCKALFRTLQTEDGSANPEAESLVSTLETTSLADAAESTDDQTQQVFGLNSAPTGAIAIASIACGAPASQTYASVLAGGIQQPSSTGHSRNVSFASTGDDSNAVLSELIAKQQVCALFS